MELNDEVIDVEPGLVIYIAPYTATACIAKAASERSCSASRVPAGRRFYVRS